MDVLLIMLWSLVSQQFLNLIFDENTFNKYKFKIFFEKFVLFYVDGYTFPSTYDVFSVHNSFPTYKLADNSLIVIQGKVEEFNLTAI